MQSKFGVGRVLDIIWQQLSGRRVLGLVIILTTGGGGCHNIGLFKIGWEEISELSRNYYPTLDVYVPNNGIPDEPTVHKHISCTPFRWCNTRSVGWLPSEGLW